MSGSSPTQSTQPGVKWVQQQSLFYFVPSISPTFRHLRFPPLRLIKKSRKTSFQTTNHAKYTKKMFVFVLIFGYFVPFLVLKWQISFIPNCLFPPIENRTFVLSQKTSPPNNLSSENLWLLPSSFDPKNTCSPNSICLNSSLHHV